MRETIFQAILSKLQTLSMFQGTDGSGRVYDYPQTAPSGYPYVVVSSQSLESHILDNQRDTRFYNYLIQIVGEKFGEQAAFTQSHALQAMRTTEDQLLAAFDADANLSNGSIILKASYGLTDGGSRVVFTIEYQAEITTNISYT
jgi:hypothetical protein